MNKQLRDEWVKALRSGEYRQGKYAMRTIDDSGNASYCCMGVLNRITDSPIDELKTNTWEKTCAAGGIKEQRYKLAKMNDDGADFPTIASWIEQNIPVVEVTP